MAKKSFALMINEPESPARKFTLPANIDSANGSIYQAGDIVALNQYLRSDSQLSTDESNIINLATTRSKKDPRPNGNVLPLKREVTISAAYYAKCFGIEPKHAYLRLRDAAATLYERDLFDPEGNKGKGRRFRILSSIGGMTEKPVFYHKGIMHFRLSEEFCSYFENFIITGQVPVYSSIRHEGVKRLRPRSMALIKYLLSQINISKLNTEPQFSMIYIDEIRRITHTKGVLPTFGNLYQKVISVAIDDINQNSSYRLKEHRVKEGKAVVAINFEISLPDQTSLAL